MNNAHVEMMITQYAEYKKGSWVKTDTGRWLLKIGEDIQLRVTHIPIKGRWDATTLAITMLIEGRPSPNYQYVWTGYPESDLVLPASFNAAADAIINQWYENLETEKSLFPSRFTVTGS